ncbi:immunoglobulin lambda-1 light chain-like [Eretmochelys imbricata]
METCCVLVIWIFNLLGAGLGGSVEPSEAAVSGGEGDRVTLRCSYNTDYSGGIYLHWYRQYPNRAPQYILRRGAKSYSKLSDTAEFAKKRFSSQADDSSTVLTIRSLERADTAVNYCGLQRAHTSVGGLSCVNTWPMIFGKGTQLKVEPQHEEISPPSVFVVKSTKPRENDGNKLTAACLVKDFYPANISVSMSQEKEVVYKSKEGILSSNGKYSMIQVIKVEPNEEVKCFVKHENLYINQTEPQSAPIQAPINNTQCEPSDSTSEEPNMEKVNMLSVTVLGLRVLLAKSIAFNMLMTVKLFIF